MSRFFLFVSVIVLATCKQHDSAVKRLFRELNAPAIAPKILVIIPLDGCNGCVDSTIEFMKSHSDNPDLLYILSCHGVKAGQKLLLSKQIILDSKARAKKLGLVNSYPVIYYLDSDGMRNETEELNATTVVEKLRELQRRLES